MKNIDYTHEHKRSFSANEKTFNHSVQYCVRDGFAFISAAEEGLQIRICFAFLESLIRTISRAQRLASHACVRGGG